jgi:hypothetical protein
MMGERGGDCVLKSGDVSKEDAFTIENQNTVCGLLESTIESKMLPNADKTIFQVLSLEFLQVSFCKSKSKKIVCSTA